ncbi:L,D-transpeptidase [Nocardia cyriacigeorgica]|uniref:L,D-transpeptidase n=1 Tax=Nocardia cyriacigeorgica TaxID=135487 RepID=UPI0010328A3A|nr:Ig-like domain-containing protein [Nocardia cyriacigeorgica]MBF6101251.1 L,D-transpeptidase family protein [Nocardia cyriacigeorgica]MBF6158142.1 L,D-transpeptidase family protein [Nocardia cyriacigeorgica]MBF6197114.1 L,D-transpeptidase family protein [Nocardia cyriacigeorgica]MBF6317615.1 L,D-transpeptidase family protein [Nocardia cyriacigeorgica]MBF6533193.1 L,D-transpeptidase family protein [Nocardia cyriacigeorgica]
MRIGRGRHRSTWKLAGPLVLLAVVALALPSCSSSQATDASVPIDRNPITELIKPKLLAPVKDGDVGVSPAAPMTFQVEDGKFTNVSLLTPEQKPVSGTLAADGRSWATTEPLGYGRTYKLIAEAVGLGGATTSTMSFTTTSPDNKTKPYLIPGEGEVVGIGQPVAIQFDENIPDRKAAQEAIKITTEPAVEGAFYWVNNREVRWRPEHFWAPGTKVTIDVNVYGKDLGDGLYGADDIHSNFTIGDAVIFTADDATKQVTVEKNGQVIRTMPTSMGKDSTPTDNGIYIVADKHREIIMDSSTYGVAVNSPDGYRTPVDFATRISYSGIFFHSAPWSVGQQGYSNTSHGCLNLSPENARWVFENAKRGDITIVKNTVGGTLSGVDGLGDWNIPWSEWKAGNADIG